MERAAYIDRARSLLDGVADRRVILGITGAPGAGKSTFAQWLVQALADAGIEVAYVPMDGFHLATTELVRLCRADRKGAPDTFDVGGYRALLQRVRGERADIWAPSFDRTLEEPVAGAVPIAADCRLVVTEGNYLLHDDGGWADIRPQLDEVWFCLAADDVRLQRLIARRVEFGQDPIAADAWARGSDQRNADLVAATAARADLIVSVD
ncbi:nucleoside/nucleotide kinase family protein [Antrihabitans cavernicola]|uniref:Nucleoside/nucleotide kinase family protein n=2 Tax=Antrihabitans cavernicola TaxID=2495913 RepID=A0A5A7SAH5_9NOCA|nr:nucleoside/nucleotide kinase family protein [Spelaeibacter cavernicola]